MNRNIYITKRGKRENLTSRISRYSMVTILIAVTVLVSLIEIILTGIYCPPTATICPVFDYFALRPASILQGKYLWTFLTSMFMHGGFFHLFANMFSLLFIGNLTERILKEHKSN